MKLKLPKTNEITKESSLRLKYIFSEFEKRIVFTTQNISTPI